ncbi:uncharacterized protein LOC119502483 [Sebastes umbrosus]|uniref:uncharacterized protein LOC119502483 n=1 Tax=Sebastes umbrosus TaxID=72105 RepID=UPI00189FE820|nr:uncharacterized protein LOC119502483 [Sebastes umbrosus]
MGNIWGNATLPEEQMTVLEEKFLQNFVMRLARGPDVTVHKSLEKFTSLSSSDNLRQHFEKRKKKAGKRAADWIKSLAEKLGGLTSAPELAGLGALAIAVFIDTVSSSPPEESTKDALRCVFAEEKASEVWDQIDECLKRCMMHVRNKEQLRSDMERMECQLSAALTKLKNSMVRDGYLSSEALRAWVNGAAFHIQMLIHLVRLGGIQTCDPVERILLAYRSDLDTLFNKHREIIEAKCIMGEQSYCMAPKNRFLVDEDSKWYVMDPITSYEKYFEAYYDHRYGRQQTEVQQHFSDVRENLQSLVHQRGSFNI